MLYFLLALCEVSSKTIFIQQIDDWRVEQNDWWWTLNIFKYRTKAKTQASLVAQTVKSLPAIQETQVWSLGGEDPLEKGMTIILVFLPVKSHGQRSLAGYSSWDCKESDMTEQLTHTRTHTKLKQWWRQEWKNRMYML